MTALRVLLLLVRIAMLMVFIGGIFYAINSAAGIGSSALDQAFGVPK